MGNLNGGYFVGDWTAPALILAAMALFVSVIGFFRDTKLQWSILAIGLLAAYTAWTFVSLLWSANKGDAWLGAGQTLLYLLVFWVAVALVALGASRRWVLAASVIGPAVVAGFTLLAMDAGLEDFFAMFEKARLIGTVGYYNGQAAFLLIPLWVAVYLGGSRNVNPVLRGAVLAGAVLSLNLAVLTQSRGAMVALAISFPVFFIFSGQRLRGLLALFPLAAALYVAFPELNDVYLAFLNEKNAVAAFDLALPTVWVTAAAAGMYGITWGLIDWRWRPPKVAVHAAGGVVLAAVVALLIVGGATLNERTGDLKGLADQKWEAFKTNDKSGEDQSRYLSASGTGRYTLWQVAWKDFRSHPVLGVGTYNYEATYYQLREQNKGWVRQPHMLPLEVLGERGAVGGVMFFGFLAVCAGVGLKNRFGNLRSEGKAQTGALLAAVTYWFVHSGAEWFWQMPAVTLPAFVYLALLVSPWQRGEVSPSLSRWPLRASGVAVAVLALVSILPLYMADRNLEQSYTAENPEENLAAIESAQDWNPVDPRLPQREAELAMETGDWERVENSYSRAVKLNPEHYEPYMLSGAFHEQRGELQQALYYYEKAHDRNPLDPDLKQHVDQLQQ